ncbi:MAG TPA: hypothetical protein VMD56_02425 [Steroidobacteraceae bacterium]|nr:hypothetical protein [Steroidobacteraceae bacterium]
MSPGSAHAAWTIAGQPGTVVATLVIACLVCFALTYRAWARARSLSDTARARVRSAPHGYVELYGNTAFPPQTSDQAKSAPLTGRACVWWRYHIYHRAGRGWDCIDRGASDSAFVLQDDTGACIVDPRGAEVTPSERQVWYGSDSWPSSPYSTGLGALGSSYKYIEQRIYEADGVCVLGELAATGGLADGGVETEVATLLHDWKNDPAALLRRFDRDGDGQLNAQEWEAARAAARAEVLAQRAQTPLVKQMARPHDGRPYLLAARSPQGLARRYRWQAAACLAGFFASLLLLAHLFGAR